MHISEKQVPVIVLFDNNWNELSRKFLTINQVFRAISRTDRLYVLAHSGNSDKIIIYKYRL